MALLWLNTACYLMQDLIFALEARPDLIFDAASHPTFPAMKQTQFTCGEPYYKKSMLKTYEKVILRTFSDM